MLHTPEGKPRISIFSIAHLSDTERMFFVSPAAQPDARLDARADRHHSACGRCSTWTRSTASCRRRANPPSQEADDDHAQAGARLRPRRACWRRRTRSTSTTRRSRTSAPGSSAACRPSATRCACSTASKARRRRRAATFDRAAMEQTARRPRQPGLPDEQRARGRAGAVPRALGDVLPARAADAEPDQDADGSEEGRATRGQAR